MYRDNKYAFPYQYCNFRLNDWRAVCLPLKVWQGAFVCMGCSIKSNLTPVITSIIFLSVVSCFQICKCCFILPALNDEYDFLTLHTELLTDFILGTISLFISSAFGFWSVFVGLLAFFGPTANPDHFVICAE